MKQSKFFSKWKPRYFRLEDGFLMYYDKKSLVGTHKNKVGGSQPRLCVSIPTAFVRVCPYRGGDENWSRMGRVGC